MTLYAYTGTLFAYLVSIWITNPLAAFAVTAVYQIIIFGVRPLPRSTIPTVS